MKHVLLFAAALLGLLERDAAAFTARIEYLHPTSHVSASGEYALFVDPSHVLGRGPADYRLTHNGETVWTNRFPFSLWNAVVSDSGAVAGCAYSHGWEGYPLVDAAGQPVWTLALPEDYEMPGQEKWGNTLFNHVQRNGAILGVGPGRTFDLYHVRDGQRVSYAVEPAEAGKWQVRETGRVPYQWTAPVADTNPPPASAALEKLGEIPLAAACGNGISNAFADAEESKQWTGPFLAAEGRELWFVAAETRTVHRFAVP